MSETVEFILLPYWAERKQPKSLSIYYLKGARHMRSVYKQSNSEVAVLNNGVFCYKTSRAFLTMSLCIVVTIRWNFKLFLQILIYKRCTKEWITNMFLRTHLRFRCPIDKCKIVQRNRYFQHLEPSIRKYPATQVLFQNFIFQKCSSWSAEQHMWKWTILKTKKKSDVFENMFCQW